MRACYPSILGVQKQNAYVSTNEAPIVPNEDFEKMRYRVNLRDIFWYRKAQMVGNKVFDATPIFRSKSPPPDASSGNPQSSPQVSNFILDVWEKRIKRVFSTGRDHKVISVLVEALLPLLSKAFD